MSLLKKIEIDFDLIYFKVSEMIGDESPQKIHALLVYLLEEVSYARHQWEECLKRNDWSLASKILHRENLFINTLDIFEKPELVLAIQNNPGEFRVNELKTFYHEMIQPFKKIEKLIIQNNRDLPI